MRDYVPKRWCADKVTAVMSASTIYACHRCGAFDVKLWRPYSSFTPTLSCIDCACVLEGVDVRKATPDGRFSSPTGLSGPSWAIGWHVPAVLISGETDMYWGYTSIPEEDLARWLALPLRMKAET